MREMFDAMLRALGYCLHPRVLLWSLAPLALAGGGLALLGWAFWEDAVAAVLLINQYDFVGVKTDTVDVYLAPGSKLITVDYVEKGGQARVHMSWYRISPDGGPQPPPSPPSQGGRWHGDFFGNRDLIGAPVYISNYERLDFAWGQGSAGWNVPSDNWSARFTTASAAAPAATTRSDPPRGCPSDRPRPSASPGTAAARGR